MERIKVSVGRTINLGNFESLRIDVGMEADTLTRDANQTFNSMTTWIDEKLNELENEERRKK
jgi:hypothetical protein